MKKYSALFDGKSMRCTLESKRGDGGKMKNKKEGLFIQCMFTVAADYIIYSLFKVWYFCSITWKSHGTTDRNGFTKSYGKCK